jgi:hypothetical protein
VCAGALQAAAFLALILGAHALLSFKMGRLASDVMRALNPTRFLDAPQILAL